MNRVIFAFLALAISSCASFEAVNSDKYDEIVGETFYTKLPPGFATTAGAAPLHPGINDAAKGFNKCESFEVIEVASRGMKLGLHVKQGDREYIINPHLYTHTGTKSMRDRLSEEFPFENREINFKEGKQWSKDLICKNSYWTGMTEEELYFVKGLPQETNESVNSQGVRKQLVYGDFGPYFYIRNGILSSWQKKR